MTRPGLRTTEFWTTIITQALAVLTLLGVVNSGDAATLRDALAQCVAAGGVFLANAWVVVRYIQSRTAAKAPRP
jgi:hypothetical protein